MTLLFRVERARSPTLTPALTLLQAPCGFVKPTIPKAGLVMDFANPPLAQRDTCRPMSQENVDHVRRAYAAFAENGIDGVIPFGAADAVVHSMPEWPDDAEYHGHDGVRKLARQWEEIFDDFGFDVHEIRDAGDSVVALLDMTGRIKGSGAPVKAQIGAVFSFTDGLIGYTRYFSTWQGALEAVGPSE